MPVNHAQKALLDELYGYDSNKDPSEQAGSELANILENRLIPREHIHWYLDLAPVFRTPY